MNRSSVAVLSGYESQEELDLLAEDVFKYYGLGCRNVSKLYLPSDFDLDRLFKSFYSYKDLVNHPKYANNYTYNKPKTPSFTPTLSQRSRLQISNCSNNGAGSGHSGHGKKSSTSVIVRSRSNVAQDIKTKAKYASTHKDIKLIALVTKLTVLTSVHVVVSLFAVSIISYFMPLPAVCFDAWINSLCALYCFEFYKQHYKKHCKLCNKVAFYCCAWFIFSFDNDENDNNGNKNQVDDENDDGERERERESEKEQEKEMRKEHDKTIVNVVDSDRKTTLHSQVNDACDGDNVNADNANKNHAAGQVTTILDIVNKTRYRSRSRRQTVHAMELIVNEN